MSGWLGCCDCLQRRVMAPARRLAAGPSPPHGHQNAAFLGDEEATSPPPTPQRQQQRQKEQQQQQEEEPCEVTAASEEVRSPPVEQYRVITKLVRPQFRDICDLRDKRPRTVSWTRKPSRGAPPATQGPRSPTGRGHPGPEDPSVPSTHSGSFLPHGFEPQTEWPAEELMMLPQRRVSQLDNIPETSETTETTETTETSKTRKASGTAEAGPASALDEMKDGTLSESGRVEDGSQSAPQTVRWEDSADPEGGGRARAASMPAQSGRRLFPRLRRRSSQRRQSASSAGRGQPSREPSKERSWLRRFSWSRPALSADQPPERPQPQDQSQGETAAATESTRSLASQRWGKIKQNFDLDAPLTEHWGFLESVDFEKVDAPAYTEHLHEQSPPSSLSTSDDEIPDAQEAQLMAKLAQAVKLRPRRRSSASRRCVERDRRRRRSGRRSSSGEESARAADTDGEGPKPGSAEDQGKPEEPTRSPPVPEEARSPPHETVHHPTWFERAAVPQAEAAGTDTVAEVSFQEFMEEVDHLAHHLQDEEFSAADPYQVLAPEQRAADDDHVVPLLNASRCVNLMLADAEKHLLEEYSNPPSPRLSPCPTPRGRGEGAAGGRREVRQAAGGGGTGRGGSDAAAGSSAGQRAGTSGAGPSRGQTVDRAGSRPENTHAADGASCRAEDRQAVGRDSEAGPSRERRANSRDADPPLQGESAEQPGPGPPEALRTAADRRESRPRAASGAEGPPRARSASEGSVRFGKLPTYLTNIQHEVAAAAESIKSMFQTTLSSSHDTEPSSSTHRSKSPQKPGNITKSSLSPSLDGEATAAMMSSEHSKLETTKSLPSPGPTPRNSITHAADRSSPPDTRSPQPAGSHVTPSALLGYRQMALALARQSTVGYQELALARQEAPEQGASCCRGVQTSPGVASPVCSQVGGVEGQPRSVQTSPGLGTPAEREQHEVCAEAVPPPSQSDPTSQPTECAPTCDSDCRSQNTPCSQCDPCPHSNPSPPPSAPTWTVPASPRPPSAPPARLLAYGRPSWLSRRQASEDPSELRHRLESGQREAGRRRDSLLRQRAQRAAQMAGQEGREGGERQGWR